MKLGIKQKTKEIIYIIFVLIFYIILQVALSTFSRNGIIVFNGVFSALQFGLCLLLISTNRKVPVRVGIGVMLLSVIYMAFTILVLGNMTAIPGICNAVFYLITLVTIANYNAVREKESVTDFLTGVLNRRGLFKYLKEKTSNGEKFSVISISLDNFKVINDTYGHTYGDELMMNVVQRMKKRVGNNGTVARSSGAEFVAIVYGDVDPETIANELMDDIREKSVLVVNANKVECYITCYGGLANCPEHTDNYETILKYADIAMFEAMSIKSKNVCCFNNTMEEKMNRQIELEHLIKKGLKDGYFYLVYQPQYVLAEKKLRGFETLLRMKTPEGQFVSPGEFIPVAEKGELILQIDEYVLRRAMLEFSSIVSENKELMVSVNVSAKNIGNIGFVEMLDRLLDETGFPAKNLEIEITEYCMVESMDITIDNITKLREMDVQIALDDFGTGYTSLNYVAKLPINLLKVDKSLVDDIANDVKSREFVETVISMGHIMGCEVISEGVEDETQLDYLKNAGCDYVQGFVWGKPLDYDIAKDLALQR